MSSDNRADNEKRIRYLIDTLNQASRAYYGGEDELMDNFEWDKLFDELSMLEQETGIIYPDSPTQVVSEDEEDIDGIKEEHEFKALSLDKTKSIAKFVKWAKDMLVWLSVKLDGCTLVVTYDDGKLVKVVTRGDGVIGTNITHLAPAFLNMPRTLKGVKGHLVIRGEAAMTYADFDAYNMTLEEPYANPRNLVAGSLNAKKPSDIKDRHITWVPFTLVHTDENITSWGERMDYLESLGFEVVKHKSYMADTLESGIEEFTADVENGTYPYPADGLVECYDDTVYAAGGSVTHHHATRAGYALKWQDEVAETELAGIEWSCAAQCITPVALFKPVALEGTTVKRASLANISECKRLGIGGAGSKIGVIKANKIIPKVVVVSEKVGDFEIPDTCPVCGAPTKIHKSASGAETLHCTSEGCVAKKLSKFSRFVSKDGVNVDGLSKANLQKFINFGWIHEYADIYKLNRYFDVLRQADGFGDRSVEKLDAAIQGAKTVRADHLLYALNIPQVGHDVIKKLLANYSYADLITNVMDACVKNDFTRYTSIGGLGPEKSGAFVKWFMDDENVAMLNNIMAEITVEEVVRAETGNKCEGLTFVVTGDVYMFKNRKALQAYVESQGGKVTGSVTKKTDYLINNDVESMSGKNKKAKELGVPIISEKEFVDKYGVD